MFDWAVKFVSKVSIFVCFSISIFNFFFFFFFFLCASPGSTFLMLTHCLYYCVASFNYGDIRAKDVGPTCWSFRAIVWQHLHLWYKQGLLYVFAVFVCFVVVCLCVCFLFFVVSFRDSNMISMGTVEFRYYVVSIILVDSGKR